MIVYVTWTRFGAHFDSWFAKMSMQFCAICSVASTQGVKRISIAIPPSSSEISTGVEKATQKGRLESRESDHFDIQIAFKLHHKTFRHS